MSLVSIAPAEADLVVLVVIAKRLLGKGCELRQFGRGKLKVNKFETLTHFLSTENGVIHKTVDK